MGLKGLIRDIVMLIVGVGLLLGWFEKTSAAVLLIAVAAVFTAYAFFRFFKG